MGMRFTVLRESFLRVILLNLTYCLDIPNLTDLRLPKSFKPLDKVTITGSTIITPLSQQDIGALANYQSLK